MIRIFVYSKQIFDKFSEDEMSVYAAQASYFTLLAAFPFFMLLLAIIQLIPGVNQSDLLTIIVDLVPDNLDAVVIQILDSLYSDSPAAILSATAVAALWSSSRGILSIERGLNRVYNVENRRNYFYRRLVCSGYTVVFSLMCVLSLALLVFGETLQKQLLFWFPVLTRFSALISQGRTLIALALLAAFFIGFYTFLPYGRQKIRYQFPGAVFATLGWAVFSFAFSIYFRYFRSYANMYGSLTAIVLLMLWLYFCICILFIGAEINWHYREFQTHGDS